MAYDRYDPRDEQPRWRDSRDRPHQPGRGEEKGFFERAGDEIASWFGDDRSGGRGRDDRHDRHDRHDRQHGMSSGDYRSSDRESRGWNPDRDGSQNRDYGREREAAWRDPNRDRNRDESYRGTSWPSSERDYNPSWRNESGGSRDDWRQQDRDADRDGGYRPMTGDYARSEQMFAASGYGAGQSNRDRGQDRGGSDHRDDRSLWGRDDYRSSSRAGSSDQSDHSRDHDPHYRSWRQQHMSELDRDYEDYRRENRSKFENDFASWRERRTHKRGLLGQVREHMDVVGSDDEHVGKVDKVAGDRIILAKSDPESGGSHHSLSCSSIDRIDGDRVILDCPADQARKDWRDESRSRALFEREDQGEMGSRTLNRAFEGTYR